MSRTVRQIILSLRPRERAEVLPPPPYLSKPGDESMARVGLAVESMKRHMTNEGWQIFQGLSECQWKLAGYGLPINTCNVQEILDRTQPKVVLVQDKREWDLAPRDFRDPMARFTHVDILRKRSDIFKLTILKDAQQRPSYHRQSAEEIGCHAWIVYYHPDIVSHIAPYVRRNHLIRTYHSIDLNEAGPLVIANGKRQTKAILSGASNSEIYPLRYTLQRAAIRKELRNTDVLTHPGYHRNRCHTPGYLAHLSKYKVAICTSSIYGYTLRKIIEASAMGCIVITDLPADECLPGIDSNLIRVNSNCSVERMNELIQETLACYDGRTQEYIAEQARTFYDYRAVTRRLAQDIELMRRNYANLC